MQTSVNPDMGDVKLLIFDLDGTLYQLNAPSFIESEIYQAMRRNSIEFLKTKLKISEQEAEKAYEKILVDYNYELSIGFEKEFGVDRYEYFKHAWDIDAKRFVNRDERLTTMLKKLKKRYLLLVLTDAPEIWAKRVLVALGVAELFGDNVLTGESDLRKSFRNIFSKIAERHNLQPSQCVVIGDHKKNDIDFAKEIGMKTIYIGPDNYDKSDYSVKDIYGIAEILGS